MNLSDRILGCLTGLAVGDALGMPTEMLTPEQIHTEYGWVDRLLPAPPWHPHHTLTPGRVTDDTGQALAILHAYDKDGGLTAQEVGQELLRWADREKDILDLVIGPSTRLALNELRAGVDVRKTGRNGKTNGAAYRAVIVGLVNAQHPERILPQIIEACLPTHGTTVAISGAQTMARATAEACREGATLQSILACAKEGAVEGRKQGVWAWSTPLEKRIELAERLVKENQPSEKALQAIHDYVGTDMLIPESVAAVFGIVALAGGNPWLAVQYGANIGGDTDTIAALAGAVCGAWKGNRAFDPTMISDIEKASKINLKEEASMVESIIDTLEKQR
jgi:ADP-ribosylglycohydrolase